MLSSLILSFALLASSFLCPNCAHTEVSLLPPPGEIIIIKDANDQGEGPRQTTQIPITAYYAGDTVYVTFLEDLGVVDITIVEVSNGVILQTAVDSSTLSAILPLSISTGEFYIYFTLSTGVNYIGSFNL